MSCIHHGILLNYNKRRNQANFCYVNETGKYHAEWSQLERGIDTKWSSLCMGYKEIRVGITSGQREGFCEKAYRTKSKGVDEVGMGLLDNGEGQ